MNKKQTIYIPKRKGLFPFGIEREYSKVLVSMVQEICLLTKELLPDVEILLRTDETGSERITRLLRDACRDKMVTSKTMDKINVILANMQEYSKQELTRLLRSALKVDVFANNPKLLNDITGEWYSQQSQLVESIVSTHTEKLGMIVSQAVQNGTPYKKAASDIIDLYDVTKKRAQFIARNEIGNLNGILSKTMQTGNGINCYIWNTCKDERVRPEHADREGDYYFWDNDTVGEINGHTVYPTPDKNPGMDYNCRCVALPVVDLTMFTGIPISDDLKKFMTFA